MASVESVGLALLHVLGVAAELASQFGLSVAKTWTANGAVTQYLLVYPTMEELASTAINALQSVVLLPTNARDNIRLLLRDGVSGTWKAASRSVGDSLEESYMLIKELVFPGRLVSADDQTPTLFLAEFALPLCSCICFVIVCAYGILYKRRKHRTTEEEFLRYSSIQIQPNRENSKRMQGFQVGLGFLSHRKNDDAKAVREDDGFMAEKERFKTSILQQAASVKRDTPTPTSNSKPKFSSSELSGQRGQPPRHPNKLSLDSSSQVPTHGTDGDASVTGFSITSTSSIGEEALFSVSSALPRLAPHTVNRARTVVEESIHNPQILIGWKIDVVGYGQGEVLEVQKKFLKSKFLIRFDDGVTRTLALKRSDKKGKVPFTPIVNTKLQMSSS